MRTHRYMPPTGGPGVGIVSVQAGSKFTHYEAGYYALGKLLGSFTVQLTCRLHYTRYVWRCLFVES